MSHLLDKAMAKISKIADELQEKNPEMDRFAAVKLAMKLYKEVI